MAEKTVSITGLKLRMAKIVENLPTSNKGSVVATLEEFQDAQDIIAAVKKHAAVPTQKWLVFDLAAIHKRVPELKKIKNLMAVYALNVREAMKHEGVQKLIRLQKRNENFYIVGGAGASVK